MKIYFASTLLLINLLFALTVNDTLLSQTVSKPSNNKIVTKRIPDRLVTIWITSLEMIRFENRSIASLKKTITEHLHELQEVYETNKTKNDILGGDIHLRFTIAPSGKILMIKTISSTFESNSLSRRINNKVKRWKYHKIKMGNTVVSLKLNFH